MTTGNETSFIETVPVGGQHCGAVLAHRGCVFSGRVLGTVALCAQHGEGFSRCKYRDEQKIAWLIPNRKMLPEIGERMY